MERVIGATLQKPKRKGIDVQERVACIVEKMMKKDRKERYQTMKDVVDDLDNL